MTASAKKSSPTHPAAQPTRPAGRFSFPKSARILKRPTFQRVYDQGRRQFSASMTFFFMMQASPEGGSSVQVGITVSRVLGGAVDRNRIKRRVRDLVRHALPEFQAALSERQVTAEIVINPKKAVLSANMAPLRAELQRAFQLIAKAPLQETGKS